MVGEGEGSGFMAQQSHSLYVVQDYFSDTKISFRQDLHIYMRLLRCMHDQIA
jgi:hypothetical protein